MLQRTRTAFLASTIISTIPLLIANTNAVAAVAPPPDSHLEEIVVSGAYEGRKVGETILGTTVLKQEDILRQLDGTIGETLRRQPGISSTFFGPGASRPVIRGLGGDRIRVLDSGLGSIDASSTSPDHAVAIDPALAERIEILRGTAMLMYGSSAAGGVVNVIDGRIPKSVPENGFDGAIRYGHTTVNKGDEVAGAINAEIGKIGEASVVFHLDGMYRSTKNYKIPGFAESARFRAQEESQEGDHSEEEHEAEAFGIVENSATKTKGGSAGLSFLFDQGFIGMNVKLQDSRYGVPGGHEHGHAESTSTEPAEEEAPVTIDLDQTRYDIHGEYETDFAFFKKAKFRFGYADYKHTEFEGAERGTLFTNKGWETRLDLVEKGGENWNGTTGIQIKSRDFSAIGAEAFVPATKSTQYGLYSVKEFTFGGWHLDLGGRFEHTKYNASAQNKELSFNGLSASAGVGYDISEAAFFGINVSRTKRAPSTEALFSNGAHLATGAFEIGDSTLGLETALGIEATFSYATPTFSFVLNGFITSYDNFIYEAETGAIQDNLEVFRFTANDAKFYGFETKAEWHAGTIQTTSFGDIDFHLDGQLDLVRAKLNLTTDNRLPRIPPLSALAGLQAKAQSFDIRTELEYAAKQTRVTEHELPTDSYLLWNAYLTVRPFTNKNISLEVRGTNLTNKEARQHTSFLKDRLPLPGRNIKASIRVQF